MSWITKLEVSLRCKSSDLVCDLRVFACLCVHVCYIHVLIVVCWGMSELCVCAPTCTCVCVCVVLFPALTQFQIACVSGWTGSACRSTTDCSTTKNDYETSVRLWITLWITKSWLWSCFNWSVLCAFRNTAWEKVSPKFPALFKWFAFFKMCLIGDGNTFFQISSNVVNV